MKELRISLLVLGLLAPIVTQAQITLHSTKPSSSAQPRMFYGGGIGLGFGDVEYYEIWPLLGVNLTRGLAVGIQFLYRHREDNRYQKTLTTEDYGATLFGRYLFRGPYYIQVEYEYLDYQYYRATIDGLKTERSDFSSIMAGGGISHSLGGNASLYTTVLYNFSYAQADSPYENPLIVRFGISVGF